MELSCSSSPTLLFKGHTLSSLSCFVELTGGQIPHHFCPHVDVDLPSSFESDIRQPYKVGSSSSNVRF